MMLRCILACLLAASASADDLYFNSSEAGCTSGNSQGRVLCDDFEDGDWYIKHCDDANSSGGLLQTDGWCGTIYASPITPTNAAECGSKGANGTDCAATSGVRIGTGGRNMADHNLSGGDYPELWIRYYLKASSGSDYNAQKHITINHTPAGTGGISVAGLGFPFGTGTFEMCPVQDCNIDGYFNPQNCAGENSPYLHQNQHCAGGRIAMEDFDDIWVYVEAYIKLNTDNTQNGEYKLWANDCGANGVCTGQPTLRASFNNVEYDDGQEIESVWFENWANPGPSVNSTEWYDQIVVSTQGPIGFMGAGGALPTLQGGSMTGGRLSLVEWFRDALRDRIAFVGTAR